jgi:hypothetical protein
LICRKSTVQPNFGGDCQIAADRPSVRPASARRNSLTVGYRACNGLALVDPHDLPAFALQDLLHGPIEHFAIRGRDLKTKGIEVNGNDPSPDLVSRGAGEVQEHLASAVFYGPDRHFGCSADGSAVCASQSMSMSQELMIAETICDQV